MRDLIIRILIKLARTSTGGRFATHVLTHFSYAIPFKRIIDTQTVVAFFHPQPVYPIHILIVPKTPLRGIESLDEQDSTLLTDILRIADQIATDHNLVERGYRIVVNAGEYQDFAQLHFHLIAGDE